MSEKTREDLIEENQHLRELIQAMTTKAKQKSIRIETRSTDRGWVIIATDAIGDEEKLANTVAGYLNVLFATWGHLREKKKEKADGPGHEDPQGAGEGPGGGDDQPGSLPERTSGQEDGV